MKTFNLHFIILISIASFGQKAKKETIIKIKPKSEFVSELMSKMTVDEKIYQLVQFTSDGTTTGPKTGENFISQIQQGKVGSILNATGAKETREIQRINLENS